MSYADSIISQHVLDTLDQYNDRQMWTVKGLGMMRLSIPGNRRVHIWHSDFLTCPDALKHTHPWSFESYIICGELHNQRFVHGNSGLGRPHMFREVACGPNGMAKSEPSKCTLLAHPIETYTVGMTYRQAAHEIHETRATDGTMSLMSKLGEDTGKATVFWQDEWQDAYERVPDLGEFVMVMTCAKKMLRRTL